MKPALLRSLLAALALFPVPAFAEGGPRWTDGRYVLTVEERASLIRNFAGTAAIPVRRGGQPFGLLILDAGYPSESLLYHLGIVDGDTILAVNGESIRTLDGLKAALGNLGRREAVIEIRKGRWPKTITLRFTGNPA